MQRSVGWHREYLAPLPSEDPYVALTTTSLGSRRECPLFVSYELAGIPSADRCDVKWIARANGLVKSRGLVVQDVASCAL